MKNSKGVEGGVPVFLSGWERFKQKNPPLGSGTNIREL